MDPRKQAGLDRSSDDSGNLPSDRGASRARDLTRTLWALAFLIALALRAAPIAAGRPYIAYIDEGNFLHPVAKLLRTGGWDPHSYLYPQLPGTIVAASMRIGAPIFEYLGGEPLAQQLSDGREVYDVLEPFSLLLVGRGLSLAAGLGVVVLSGAFAQRVGGPVTSVIAMLLAALTPALALRGPIATVDPYAALFTTVCLFVTDLMRTSPRPGRAAFWAGMMAGCAFASKYPAVLVVAAPAVTTCLLPVSVAEKLRRIALLGLGTLVGALVAMPAIVAHPGAVFDAIRQQAMLYQQLETPGLWEQAFIQASNMGYARGEIGLGYMLCAAAGWFLAVRDRSLAPTAWGWAVFSALALTLYSNQSFRPFRNLLPLMPILCLTAALLLTRLRERVEGAPWFDASLALWLVGFFALPLGQYAWGRMRVEDSRTQAVDWLAARAGADDQVVVVRELGFVRSELARTAMAATVPWWKDASQEIRNVQPRYLVVGVLERENEAPVDIVNLGEIRAAYVERARLGEQPTPAGGDWWRGNRQIISILEVRGGARSSVLDLPRRGARDAAPQ